MTSVLHPQILRKHKTKWNLTKSLIIIILFTILLLYITNTQSLYGVENRGITHRKLLSLSNTTQPTCEPNIQPLDKVCSYLVERIEKGICPESPYLRLLYCNLTYAQPVFYILMTIWLPMLFYILASTAQDYFCPALSKMSDYLRLSPNIAGVTLLALGNGAPDLSSIIIGLFTGNAAFGIGAPTGAGVYVTTVVLGLVTLLSDVKVTRRPFIRDAGFYLFAVCFMFIAFITNKVMIWQSILCLVIYVLYVLVVVVGRMIYQRLKKKRLEKKKRQLLEEKNALVDGEKPEDESNDWSGGWHAGIPISLSTLAGQTGLEISSARYESNIKNDSVYIPKIGIITKSKDSKDQKDQSSLKQYPSPTPNYGTIVLEEHFSFKDIKAKADEEYEELEDDDEIPKRNIVVTLWKLFIKSIGWKEKKWYYKIYFVCMEAIWIFIRNLTVFKADETQWNKWFAACVPIFAPVLILFAIGPEYVFYLIGGYVPILPFLMIGGLIFSIIILLTTRRNSAPFYQPVFVFCAFGLSIVWIYISANQLVDLLEALGTAWGIPSSVLAITVLAWGNSIGDTISDIVVAREGYPAMAVGACLGGPLMNLLIGLGIALTFNPMQLRTGCYPLSPDANVSISFLFLIASLVLSLIVIPACKFRSRKPYGVVLIILYLVYMAVSLTAALYKPFGQIFSWKFGSC